MMHFHFSVAVALATLLRVANAQAGPNTLAVYNPANRTTSTNSTYCILPVPKAIIEKITKGYKPLDVPTDILPAFPAGMHPLIVEGGYQIDIRMTALNLAPLQIPSLMQGAILVPFADVSKDGKTPFNVPVNYYIGGTSGNDLAALVPAIVGAVPLFEGTVIAPAQMVPDTAAVQSLPGGLYSFQVKPLILPNPVSGPGVVGEAFDLIYSLTSTSPYTAHTFHSLLNNPQLLDNGMCQRQSLYFNETFAYPKMAVGNITLYNQPLLNTPPKEIAGTYTNVYCYQANAELVASYIGETCPIAAARSSPSARE
ncbi:hypothetical protein LEL_07652 [Akanthomyces lecanii RCEF 1005]|uniref:Uncharacterized protein n=1 Tax=Akanthomyces lecanii RCEF 1005 TaxID=1081108 RepID=A0A168FV93_CORDF|nr:hypothetical protein LEL_07652 [Akanthomyces lecanii RCEF 1005]